MPMRRKDFLITASTLISGLSLKCFPKFNDDVQSVRFGIITDLHYAARIPAAGNSRFYNESLEKLAECVEVMNGHKVDFFIQLGDFKDQDESPDENTTLNYLSEIEAAFRKFKGPVYHVLGNHDHDSISKIQYLNHISNWGFERALNYYSYDMHGFHFLVLDANYTSDEVEYNKGNFDWKDTFIPEEQLEWLNNDLKEHSGKPAVVFIHQRLDDTDGEKNHFVKNSQQVRAVLNKYGNVLLVLQGHDHRGAMNRIDDIYYFTLKAAVEGSGLSNNNYAILEINEELKMKVTGFRNTDSFIFT